MRKIKTFIYSFYQSTTSLDYYVDIIHANFSFSIKYFIFFSLLYSILNAAWLFSTYIQPAKPVIDRLPQHISSIFPHELTILIADGQVQTNVQEPYVIPMTRITRIFQSINQQVKGITSQTPTNLLVIDTQSNLQDFGSYDTYALMTANALVYRNPRPTNLAPGEIEVRVLSLEGINGYINQDVVASFLLSLNPYLNALMPISFALLILLSLSYLPYVHFIYLMIISGIILFIAKLIDTKLDYSQSLQISIHLFSVITILMYGLRLLGLDPGLPFLRSMIIIFFSMAALLRIRETSRLKRKSLKARGD